jgi:ribose/xylose/arabinose/galactoside ABC-type transport system permease subunit
MSVLTAPRFPYRNLPRGFGLVLALVVLIVGASLISPHFLNPINILNVLRQVALYGILGVGMTFILLTAGIDLSISSIVGFVGVVSATLMGMGYGIPLSCLAGLLAGLAIGTINGLGVVVGRVPPFIMTLGAMVMTRGIALMLADGATVNLGPRGDDFFFLGGGFFLGIPTPIWVFALVCVVAFVVLRLTPYGRAVYAVGSSTEAARLAGINVGLVTFSVYLISAGLASLSALIFLSRLSVGDPNSGVGLELEAITIAVIGGTSLFGGEGGVLGTIGGAMVLAILANILNLAGVSPFSQQVVKGVIIIFAVLLEAGRRRRA